MKLKDFTRGWLIGDFEPSLIKTKDIEVAIKKHVAGEVPPLHYHKEVEEYNIVLEGEVSFDDVVYKKDDIIIIEKNQITNFKSITDSTLLVIKSKSVKDDKYYV